MASNLQSQPKWTSKVVRDTFLQYFQGKGHTFGMFEEGVVLGKDELSIDNSQADSCYSYFR